MLNGHRTKGNCPRGTAGFQGELSGRAAVPPRLCWTGEEKRRRRAGSYGGPLPTRIATFTYPPRPTLPAFPHLQCDNLDVPNFLYQHHHSHFAWYSQFRTSYIGIEPQRYSILKNKIWPFAFLDIGAKVQYLLQYIVREEDRDLQIQTSINIVQLL